MQFDTVLIDGDVLVYRCGFAGQESLAASLGNVKKTIYKILDKLCSHGEADIKVLLSSTDRSNYRYDIARTREYKGNRKGAPKPEYYEEIRDYLMDHWNGRLISGEEADDALGIAQTLTSCIVSTDKDLNMIPGWHYNFVKEELYEITDNDNLNLLVETKGKRKTYKMDRGGIKWFYAQLLLGDTCDNIPGVKGYGPVKVHELLINIHTEVELAKAVYKVYTDNKLTKERFLEVCDLAWIRRKPNEIKSEEVTTYVN